MISMSRCGCVPKPCPGCDAVLVDHAQRAEAHVLRVVVVGEREGVAAVEPAVVGVPALVAAPELDHGATIGQRAERGSPLVIVGFAHYDFEMAFLIRRGDGRIEIRESIATAAGPRARSLASVQKVLGPEAFERAARRATRPLDVEALRARALELGFPVSERREDRRARELLALLRAGGAIDPPLAAQLRDELAEHSADELPVGLAEVAEWVGADDRRRGEALRGLLRVSDRIVRGREPVRSRRRRRFPRFRSRKPRGA